MCDKIKFFSKYIPFSVQQPIMDLHNSTYNNKVHLKYSFIHDIRVF